MKKNIIKSVIAVVFVVGVFIENIFVLINYDDNQVISYAHAKMLPIFSEYTAQCQDPYKDKTFQACLAGDSGCTKIYCND